ncbi:MAG: YeeE/YedE family protein [Pseudomonadota bacterium]
MVTDVLSWGYGFGGGLLIGCSAALYLLLNGRIAGISGVFGGLLSARPMGDGTERALFLAGLIGAPALWVLAGGAPAANAPTAPLVLIIAGLLVGVGTRMGGGCTSGHGVCGMTRLSRRSFVAVGVFMAVAAAAVTIGRHVVGAL